MRTEQPTFLGWVIITGTLGVVMVGMTCIGLTLYLVRWIALLFTRFAWNLRVLDRSRVLQGP